MSISEEQWPILAEALARHMPTFRSLTRVRRLTAGASLETYRLDVELDSGAAQLALRRTPGGTAKLSDNATPSLETEARLLQVARDHGVPEPQVHFVLKELDGLGQGFLMEWVNGETLGRRIVRSDALAEVRPKLARQCGEILGRIHSIDVAATGLQPLLDEIASNELIAATVTKYQSFDVPRPMLDYTARWLLSHVPMPSAPRLVHNDFRNGNLIVTPEGIAAVLDWEHACLGNPMRDVGYLCCNSWRYGRGELPVGGFGSYDDLAGGYEAVTGSRPDREQVRYWQLFASFWWAVGCMELANQHRSGRSRSVERLAIGRRVSECEIDCVNILIPGPVEIDEPAPVSTEFADPQELLESVTEFLRQEVSGGSDARLAYLAKVAGNSLDIVSRELRMGSHAAIQEQAGLERLLGHSGDLEALRRELCEAIRSGGVRLHEPKLANHLRRTVAMQITIDQPLYWGMPKSLSNAASQKSASENLE